MMQGGKVIVTIAVLFVEYQGPPLSVLAGMPLALVSLQVAFAGAFLRMWGSTERQRLAMRLLWAGNVGCVTAAVCWLFLQNVYLW
jgi:hypothetical protein